MYTYVRTSSFVRSIAISSQKSWKMSEVCWHIPRFSKSWNYKMLLEKIMRLLVCQQHPLKINNCSTINKITPQNFENQREKSRKLKKYFEFHYRKWDSATSFSRIASEGTDKRHFLLIMAASKTRPVEDDMSRERERGEGRVKWQERERRGEGEVTRERRGEGEVRRERGEGRVKWEKWQEGGR